MELRRLREFIALAEVLHFGRAASKLNMDQGPLSRRIKELERILGVMLFARTSQGTQLTPRGEALLPYARILIAQNELARRILKEPLASTTVRLRLGWSEDLPLRRTMGALSAFAVSMPQIAAEVTEDSYTQIIEDLRFALIDVALTYLDPQDPALNSDRVWTQRGCAVLPLSHPLADRAAIPVQALKDAKLFLVGHASRKSFVVKRLQSMLYSSLDEPQIVFIDRLRVTLATVFSGKGIAIVGPGEAEMIQTVDFAVVPLTDPKAEFSTFAVYGSKSPPAAVEAFIQAARSSSEVSALAEMPDPEP